MALIIVLWIVAVLGTITMLFNRQATLSLKVNRNTNNASEARMLAEAGIYRLMAELVTDKTETTYDSLDETWSQNAEAFGNVMLGNGTYSLNRSTPDGENSIEYGAVDECSKININTANRDMLMRLPNAEEEVIDAIIDWRDDNDTPATYGAESEYYESLSEPYQAKNAFYDSVEELLLVKGMTLDLLYGEDTNTNGLLDANENDGNKTPPLDNSDGELERGWHPYITAYSYEKNVSGEGESRVNINSAKKDELKQTFNKEITDKEIDAIISVRDEEKFASIGELMDKTISSNSNNNSNNSANNNNKNNNRNNRNNNRNNRNNRNNQNKNNQNKNNNNKNNNNKNNNNKNNNNNNTSNSISLSKEKFKNIAGKITVSDEEELVGKININTAPKMVLNILFNDEDLVEKIIEYRKSGEAPFDNIGELMDIQGMSKSKFIGVCGNICAKSSVFSARSSGLIERSRAYKEIYAVVDRGVDPPEIRYWKVLR